VTRCSRLRWLNVWIGGAHPRVVDDLAAVYGVPRRRVYDLALARSAADPTEPVGRPAPGPLATSGPLGLREHRPVGGDIGGTCVGRASTRGKGWRNQTWIPEAGFLYIRSVWK